MNNPSIVPGVKLLDIIVLVTGRRQGSSLTQIYTVVLEKQKFFKDFLKKIFAPYCVSMHRVKKFVQYENKAYICTYIMAKETAQ